MSLKDVEEGRYMAKITNYGLKKNENVGKIECMIQLKFKAGDQEHWITWKGFFTIKDGAPNKNTIDALLTCGFKGNDPSVLAEGPEGNKLDMDSHYSIVLEKNDSDFLEVAWINTPGGAAFKDVLSKGDAVKQMSGLKIGGAFMKARKELGQPKPKNPDEEGQNFGPEPSFDSEEEIPF